jgi:phospholipid/cholesterol/gamma-HCH transport system substrate-binding protein
MVTQAPKRSAVAAALLFTLSCVGLIIFVWTEFGGTIPFSAEGYRIKVTFTDTSLLVPNADVRIAGVNVGKVSAVSHSGIDSIATINLQQKFAPIPADTRAILRQKTLLGEAFIELSTGTATARKLPDGGALATGQVDHTQALDQVLGSFNTETQQNLQSFLYGTYNALAGQGENLNAAIGNLEPTFDTLNAVVHVLNDQQGNLRSLISNTATVLGTVGDRGAQLESLITSGDQVLSATAARNTQLTATVNALPPFLSQLRTTLGTLNTTLGLANPTLIALRPVAPLLKPALSNVIKLSGPAVSLLHQVPALLNDGTAALPAITRFLTAFKPAADNLLPAEQELVPLMNLVSLYPTDLTSAMANLGADLEATAPSLEGGTAHYLRSSLTLSPESLFGLAQRPPSSRHNAYHSPGELANLGSSGGLESSDCRNTGNASLTSIVTSVLGGNTTPCKVQPGFTYNGITQYYPHVTRAPR